ncbi:MAG: hypothetical protein R6U64_10715 [Bacteroidales bacterium]
MKNTLEIKPLVGFGDLKFGASKQEVEEYFGKPQEIEMLESDEDSTKTETWNYWEEGHTVYFEKEEGDVCFNFETDDEQVTLFGKKVFEMDLNEVLALMNEQGYQDHEIDDEEEGERILSFFDAMIDFVFDENGLGLISWSAGVDENDKLIWPE